MGCGWVVCLAGGVDKSIHPLYIEIVEPLTERTIMVKFELRNASLAVPVVGSRDTTASLHLNVADYGNFGVNPHWNLTCLLGRKILGLNLCVPLGTLQFIGDISVSNEENLVFRAQEARWSGDEDFFSRGVSPYGDFRSEIVAVAEGTYMLPEDYQDKEGRILPSFLPMETRPWPSFGSWALYPNWPCHYKVSWETYRRRQQAVERRHSFKNLAVHAAKILDKPANDRSTEEHNALQCWHELIRTTAQMG
jgi:hypothetical protein